MDLKKLLALCSKYEDGFMHRTAFWEQVIPLGFSRSEISACRLFVRLASKDGKVLSLGGLS